MPLRRVLKQSTVMSSPLTFQFLAAFLQLQSLTHSQTVICSCSKETDQPLLLKGFFLSECGLHSYCIRNEYKSHVISASASACLYV